MGAGNLEDAMTGWILSRVAMAATVAAILTVQAMAQKTPESAGAQKAGLGQSTNATKRVIVVSLEDRKLALVEDGEVKKVYVVAVGKPSTPSPVGEFTIARRVANPTYSHDGKIVAAGPGNPVGTRWMGLSVHGYGIHGTNEPRSIGKAASHGCIRMAKADLEELYPLVQVGDAVELIGQRNEETARLFGPTPVMPAAQQPVLAQSAPVETPAADVANVVARAIAVVAVGAR
jgi:lipoprotein-anchoring transpeptidase ErfK/SrfK